MLTEDVRQVSSVAELADAIKTEAAKSKPAVRLGGLDRNRLPAPDLQRLGMAWLNDLVPDRPLFIKSIEGHSAWYNARAWELIGADAVLSKHNTSDEAAQMRERGRIHGHAYEELTTPVYDSFSFEERREGMELVLKEAARVGLTGIHCLEGYGEYRRHDFELILELDGRNLRFNAVLPRRDSGAGGRARSDTLWGLLVRRRRDRRALGGGYAALRRL